MTRAGLLLVDKPQGLTSHDVVARVRRIAGTRKVGHAGTLDPMATGLLIVGVESATRLLTHVVGADKEYFATVRLGQATVSDDAEGEVIATADAAALAAVTDEAIEAALTALTGAIDQVPSSVSAIKVDGRRAYDRVRAGEEPDLAARRVTIVAFDLLATRRRPGDVGAPAAIDLEVRVECSSGTYIRALARDLGRGLGVGGHLTALRRTRVGVFDVTRAATLEQLADGLPAATVTSGTAGDGAFLDLAAAASLLFEPLELDRQQATDLGHGKKLQLSPTGGARSIRAAVAPGGALVALVEVTAGGIARVVTGFPARGLAGSSSMEPSA